jgi:hypothetical protein
MTRMRRWLSIAAFSLVLLALPVWAQRHGGGGGGGAHFAARGGSAVHSSVSSSVHSSGAFRGSSGGRSSGVHLRIGNPYYSHRGSYGRRSYYPYAAYYPYYGWYSDPLYDAGDQDSNANADVPVPYRDDGGLQSDVQALNGKVDRLQADVEARDHPKTEMEPATALVFRDKHVEEVRNYAIAGGTLWVLNESAAKKIPLDQLDLAATAKMNDDRGVDFQVPGPTLSLQIVR